MKKSKWILVLITILFLMVSVNFVGFAQKDISTEEINGNTYNYLVIPLIEPDFQKIFLPLVTRNYCVSPHDSPFSIQIAGLSDLTTTSISTSMTKSEYDEIRKLEYAELDAIFPTLIDALKESGAGWVRVYIDWAVIEPEKGDFDWDWYDKQLKLVASTGVKIIATVANPPAWAAVNPYGLSVVGDENSCSNVVLDPNNYYSFLDQLVKRYKKLPYLISTWEIMNEPDAMPGYRCLNGGLVTYGITAEKYAEITKGSYLKIKSIDPSAKVILGGLAYDNFYKVYKEDRVYDASLDGKFNRYFIDDVLKIPDNSNYFDGINFHFFKDFEAEWIRWTDPQDIPTCGIVGDKQGLEYKPYGKGVIAKGSHLIGRLKTCFNVTKPLWISEVGHHGTADISGEDYDLNNQARYVWKVYPQSLSLGAENVTWYALKIVRTITLDDYQGLLDDNNNPKPAFYAYKTLTSELNGYRYDEIVNTGTSNEAYKFYNPCEGYKIVAWYNTTDENASNLWNLTGVSKISLKYRPDPEGGVYDKDIIYDGGIEDLDGTINGSIRIRLTIEPVIIHLYP